MYSTRPPSCTVLTTEIPEYRQTGVNVVERSAQTAQALVQTDEAGATAQHSFLFSYLRREGSNKPTRTTTVAKADCAASISDTGFV